MFLYTHFLLFLCIRILTTQTRKQRNMSAFVIFAIVLTVIYMIYYAGMITKDLYGKKNQQITNQETFNFVADEHEEVATEVSEVGDGFSFSTDKKDDMEEETEISAVSSTEDIRQAQAELEVKQLTQADSTILKIYDSTEQIQPEHSVELESKEFRMALLNREKIPGNLLKVKKDEL